MTDRTIRIATRGSDLALRQAALVADQLRGRRYDVDLVEVETTGDQIRDELIHRLGKTGAFVRSLDEKVLNGEVDFAVHSMKDMPTDGPAELLTVATPERAAAEDVLVTPDGSELSDLPSGAVIGTSSLRRRAQLLNMRPDVTVEPLRGNVDTRVEKLLAPHRQAEHERRAEAEREFSESAGEDDRPDREYDRTVEEWFDDLAEIERRALEREVETEFDAIVLARAGLERAGLDHHVGLVDLHRTRFVPAPGQGAIAVTGVDGDLADEVNRRLDHPRTRVETTVERAILAELGGGCIAPVGIHAIVQGEYVHAEVQVFEESGDDLVGGSRDLPVERHREAAREFARDLADRGARELIEDARADASEGTRAEE